MNTYCYITSVTRGHTRYKSPQMPDIGLYWIIFTIIYQVTYHALYLSQYTQFRTENCKGNLRKETKICGKWYAEKCEFD